MNIRIRLQIKLAALLLMCKNGMVWISGKQTEKIAMVTAKWNGVVIAQSDKCKQVEGNYYFPPESIKSEYLTKSDTTTVCSWKGTASYYDVKANGEINKDAAWYYPHTKDAARDIEGYVAFWKGVRVEAN